MSLLDIQTKQAGLDEALSCLVLFEIFIGGFATYGVFLLFETGILLYQVIAVAIFIAVLAVIINCITSTGGISFLPGRRNRNRFGIFFGSLDKELKELYVTLEHDGIWHLI